ncbi:MAG TPA: hypothetical protein VLI90_13925, partial [Tepidisphaeraceae bacterium]|nr:hypothetical protein [Tepidisphaeraceae bacterium]
MMRSSIGVVLVLVTLLVSPAFAATPDQIEAAIQKAKAFVYSQQKEGIWEKRADPPPDSMRKEKGFNYKIDGGQWGGLTALATYALVA